MNWETILSIGTFIISVIAIGVSVRKGQAETSNLDADTYEKYQKSLAESHENYQCVLRELEEMKKRLKALEQEYERLECHNKALIAQLVENRITPIDIEEAIKRKCK